MFDVIATEPGPSKILCCINYTLIGVSVQSGDRYYSTFGIRMPLVHWESMHDHLELNKKEYFGDMNPTNSFDRDGKTWGFGSSFHVERTADERVILVPLLSSERIGRYLFQTMQIVTLELVCKVLQSSLDANSDALTHSTIHINPLGDHRPLVITICGKKFEMLRDNKNSWNSALSEAAMRSLWQQVYGELPSNLHESSFCSVFRPLGHGLSTRETTATHDIFIRFPSERVKDEDYNPTIHPYSDNYKYVCLKTSRSSNQYKSFCLSLGSQPSEYRAEHAMIFLTGLVHAM